MISLELSDQCLIDFRAGWIYYSLSESMIPSGLIVRIIYNTVLRFLVEDFRYAEGIPRTILIEFSFSG